MFVGTEKRVDVGHRRLDFIFVAKKTQVIDESKRTKVHSLL